MAADRTEIRFELPIEEVSVLDGYCSATGKGRTDVLRYLLKDWSDRRLHEAIAICRTAGVNPSTSDKGRADQCAPPHRPQ
jgi:hypothetical protein